MFRMPLILILIFIVPFAAPAQDDTSDIFADLTDLTDVQPDPGTTTSPAASQAVPAPPVAISHSKSESLPETTPLMLQMSKQEKSPAVYPGEDGSGSHLQKPDGPESTDNYLARGKKAYENGNLDEAQKLFEAMLHDDAYSMDAIKWLRRIADKKAERETRNYNTTRTQMLESVQAAWNTPKAEGVLTDSAAAHHEPTAYELRTAALRSKLENIHIPEIDFQNSDIQQVVQELSATCRQLDPEQKGVNLVVFGTSQAHLPPVTFSGTDLTALEALDIITRMSGMKYTIGPHMVSLTPVDYEPPQQMVSIEFDIMPSVGSKMMMRSGEAGLTDAGVVDVRDFFSTVPFPQGSSAQYNPEFNVLLVRNIPKHIDKVKELLDRYARKALEERSRQVEIETKFIEVAQGTLDELGFEWTIGEAGQSVGGDISLAGGQKIFTDTLRSGENAFSSGISTAGRATSFNSYAGSTSDSIDSGLIGTAGELLIEKTTGTPIELLIRALERTSGSDLLSAPKILTTSGTTATIHVGEVHWYPTAFDVELERYSQPSLIPLDYEEEKTGVMLEVTPELDPENGTINMALSPEIRELAGYDEQHVGTIWPDFGDEQLNMGTTEATSKSSNPGLFDFLTSREENRTVNADRLIARRPIFRTRKIHTNVTIEDGSTIAMGGLIKEKLETYKDSVPILGHIPLLGRLFRSEGKKSVKRNLLIFVTANQVDATGHKKSIE
jgi:general secretion pathway protein D